ncbi:hypothetical protein DL765_004540 [Monosporascus sp. GIB2]|nr:hypothetical protein DL765_004540 [Monosporascus sp. GIB2]
MAEVFATAASALAVTELAGKVLLSCGQYWKDVASAREDIGRVEKEARDLKNATESVDQTRLPIAQGAAFDSHAEEHNPTCLQNTRVELLREIDEWIQSPNTEAMFWLNGMAGTGKSTISRTLAHTASTGGYLGGSFFFKRGEGDRGGVLKLFSTLAAQLVSREPAIAPHLQHAIDADPAIFGKAMREQFEKLILQPFSNVSRDALQSRTLLIVVDALDECDQEEDIKRLILLFSNSKRLQVPRLKIFLTSRPDLPTRLGFAAIKGAYQDLILHEVAEAVIEHDIRAFFEYELARVREEYNSCAPEVLHLPARWPSEDDMRILVKMAVPLFIFAATVCRFIADRKGGNPHKKLNRVLEQQTKSQESKLDATYMPVLEQLLVGLSGRQRATALGHFRTVVGSIVVLASPLSALALTQLLNTTLDDVLDILDLLGSVLSIPSSSEQPIRLLHLSFRDFLLDPEKRESTPFWIDEKEAHRRLATQCLRVMNDSLRTDICAQTLEGHSDSVESVAFSPNSQLVASASRDATVRIWSVTTGVCQQTLEGHSDSVNSVAFSPGGQFLASGSNDKTIKIWSVATGEERQTFESHSGNVNSVAFSSDGQFVASGSDDKTVKIWLVATGEEWQTLEGHSDNVNSVGFSSDDRLVASTSEDRTVKLWSVATGACQQTLEGHSSSARSVAFSPDAQLVASASDDHVVKIWLVATGEEQQTLEGGSFVAFSPDGQLVASASYGYGVKLWLVVTGEEQQTLEGHSSWVWWVAFSPDSQLMASASYDNTIKIWLIATGEERQTPKGHFDEVESVIFSPDGQLVASTSRDATVRIWSVTTGVCQQTLKGHNHWVNSVIFSPDNQLVASACNDAMVRIWSVTTGVCQQTLEGHRGSVWSAAFSPDSQLVASASHDNTVRLWSVATGACQQTVNIAYYDQ